MENIISVTIPFFALIGCGYLAGRSPLFSADAVRGLNAFVWNFALPCLIFRALALRPLAELIEFEYMAAYAVTGWTVYILTAAMGRVLFKTNLGVAVIQGQAACVSNIGYMGLPLLIALFGDAATIPAVLAMLVDMFFIQSPSMALLEANRHTGAARMAMVARIVGGFLRNPFIISMALGVGVSALQLPLPGPIDSFTGLLAAATAPCALFAVGASLAGRPIADRFSEVAFMSGCKLFLHPLIAWVMMFMVFDIDTQWATIAVLGAALPVGGNIFVVAHNFGVYSVRASTAIIVSTALAVVTFSALVGMVTL
ncbi:MAG: AEC family transporter [Rhodospirillales bacterium]|nr:AEC family transporter [Rhodospirillales bacterium]